MRFPDRKSYRKAWDEAYSVDPEIPLNLDLELSSTCNLRCSFCKLGDPGYRRSHRVRFMDTELAIRLIHEAAGIGIPAIKLNFRGESLLHPEFSKIITEGYAIHVANRKPAFYDILINTNANFPVKDSELLEAASKVMISLDSFDPDIYEKIRRGGDLEKVLAFIDALAGHHPNLWVRRVICKENKDEDFVAVARARWGKKIHVSEHYAFDRNDKETQAVHGEKPSSWKRTYCGYPSQRLVVTAEGVVLPCCLMWGQEYVLGDVREKSLRQIWESRKRKDLVAVLRNNAITMAPAVCQDCTSYLAYQRPERDWVRDRDV